MNHPLLTLGPVKERKTLWVPIVREVCCAIASPGSRAVKETVFARLREIRVRTPVQPFKISSSCAYLSALKTAADVVNRIGKKESGRYACQIRNNYLCMPSRWRYAKGTLRRFPELIRRTERNHKFPMEGLHEWLCL